MDGHKKSGLEEFGSWLAGLSLVSQAERALSIACWVLGGFVLVAMLLNIGWWQALLVVKSHAWAYLIVLNAAPRPWTWRLLGLVVLSLLHVFAFAMFAVPGLGIVSVIYFAGGLLLLARFYSQLGSASQQLRDVESYSRRDDFKWLVTTAPLATRQCLHRAVQSAISQTTPNEPPPS